MTPAAILAVAALAQPEAREAPPNVVVPVVHSLALMTVMRGAESYLYPDPFSKPRYFSDHYKEAFTQAPIFDASKPAFRWDGDPLAINIVGHGLFGSELYLRARQCRWGVIGSLAFAAATSGLWEYAFEGNGVRPSAQDLIYTPLAGLALGEARYWVYRAAQDVHKLRVILRVIVDPFGEIERAAGTGC